MNERQHRERLPITSRVWFFPTLLLLTPLLTRACTLGAERRPAMDEQVCVSRYELCVGACSSIHFERCMQMCQDEFNECLEAPDESADASCEHSDSSDPYSDEGDGLSCW
ncbi:MAG: hypothetical protein R6X02_07050 [Enhygromyxa sp.]